MSDTPITPAAPDFTQCPNWGQGGSFVYDPVTRQRTRAVTEVQALQVQQPPQPATEEQSPAIEPVPQQKKEKNRG